MSRSWWMEKNSRLPVYPWAILMPSSYIDDVKNLEIEKIGPKFENHEMLPGSCKYRICSCD